MCVGVYCVLVYIVCVCDSVCVCVAVIVCGCILLLYTWVCMCVCLSRCICVLVYMCQSFSEKLRNLSTRNVKSVDVITYCVHFHKRKMLSQMGHLESVILSYDKICLKRVTMTEIKTQNMHSYFL